MKPRYGPLRGRRDLRLSESGLGALGARLLVARLRFNAVGPLDQVALDDLLVLAAACLQEERPMILRALAHEDTPAPHAGDDISS